MSLNDKNRTRKSNSVLVGVIAFLLGFLFALIVLFGSIFGIGYVAATTDINKVLSVFGLENKNADYDENDTDSNKYNYINADQAPNIYKLVTEIMNMANDGLGEINLDRISALAPVTDAVLDMGYKYIDGVVDFDKEYFEGVPLTSIIDAVKNSMYYVHTGKITETLNKEAGTEIDLSEVPIAGYMIDGIEAEYATVTGKGDSFRLPVLFDYYVNDGSAIGYGRTIAVNGTSAYPDNLKNDTSYIQETTLTNADGNKLYKVFYVPCKVTDNGIEEADYTINKLTVEDPNVTFTKDDVKHNLKYKFSVVEYGGDTDFIAVKPNDESGAEKFTLDYSAIKAAKNNNPQADDSNRYVGYSYYAPYARNYYVGPAGRVENDMVYGVTTINNINFFKDNAGNIIEYDPLLVSDILIDPLDTLNHVPVWSVVNTSQAQTIKDIFGDTSLGDVLNQNVNFNDLIDDIQLSTFINGVSPDDKVMTYLVFNISDVKKTAGGYTATYDKNGEKINAVVKVSGGEVVGVSDASTGKSLKGNTVADVTTITDDLTIDVFMDVKADDPILMYLGFGVTDVYKTAGQDYGFVGDYNGEPAYIYANSDGTVDRIVTEGGATLSGTGINGISDRVNNITDVLSLPDFIDVDPEESILAYLGYGIYDIEAQTGNADGRDYQYVATYKKNGVEMPVYIAAENNGGKRNIISVWSAGGNIGGTKIDQVSDRLDTITDVLTITEFVDIDPSDAIMAYMGYGVNKCEQVSGTDALGNHYDYKCKYTPAGGTETECYISLDAQNNAESVWYVDGGVKKTVRGTKISDVPDRINNLQNTLTIGEIITVDDNNASMILKAIKDTTIGGLDERIKVLTVSDVLEDDKIKQNSVLSQLRNAHITELGNEIDKVLIQRIYSDKIYGDGKTIQEVKDGEFNPAYLYYEMDENGAFNLTEKNCAGLTGTAYDNMLGKLTQSDWDNRGSTVYYTYGAAQGMWKLILYRIDSGVKTEKAYTINNFNNMVTACSNTVYNSTLGELQEAGIIDNGTDLTKCFKAGVDSSLNQLYFIINNDNTYGTTADKASATQMKDLTLKQLLNFVDKILGA